MRVLIAGLGAIGQRHARNLRALRPDVELLAYRQRRLRYVISETLTRDDGRDVESELGIRVFTDLGEALAARPDAVFVCNPTSQHLDVARQAAEHGAHLFIEKPVSHTIDGLARLQRLVAERRLVALVGCQWRFHPGVVRLKTLLESGVLGSVRGAEIEYAEYLPGWHPYEDYRESYAARAELGGGVVLTHIHDYDLAWWLFGEPRTVHATGGHESELEIDVEDTVRATLSTSLAPVIISQTFASREIRRRITVTAERATVTVDLVAGRLDVSTAVAPGLSFAEYQRNEMFNAELAHFLACIEQGTTPVIPLGEGIAVLRVALAVKESLRNGRLVELG
ncbi:MAG: Gfo/Idh/MocA family oxidoreductase [Gemmatimonadota bacterium]|mgnify:CR=1 FL=1